MASEHWHSNEAVECTHHLNAVVVRRLNFQATTGYYRGGRAALVRFKL